MNTTIYHNPRCSKSRQTLELLQQQGLRPRVVLYLQTPPSESELAQIMAQLGVPATALLRFSEQRASELGLQASDSRSEAEWISILAANPILIERPIVVHGNRARIGRPPEKVLEIL